MSVILKNKDMPNDCYKCGAYYKSSQMNLICPYDHNLDLDKCCNDHRHADCPLVDISDIKSYIYAKDGDIYLRLATYGSIIEKIKLSRKKAKLLKRWLKIALKESKKGKDHGLS